MNIKTRHGYEKPIESDLEDYQLGWSIDEGCLYIKDPSQEGDKVLRVLSDKALLDANQKFIKELQNSLNDFSDTEISKAKEELKKLYEKKTTYVIEFGVPVESEQKEGVDYTVDTEFDYYTKETADEAVASFIEKLNSLNIANQDPDIKNAGSKIIISKADHSVAYLYMILENEEGKEYGQLINTLEQSFPSLVLEWSDKKENTIEFKLNDEVLNEINFSNMVVDEGSWSHGEGVKLNPSLDNEYIEYVSPICFKAKKDCYVRPNQYIEYDDDYAYGYRSISSGIEDFMTNGAQLDIEEGNWFSPTRISKKISSNGKRNKYYTIFRISDNSTITSQSYMKCAKVGSSDSIESSLSISSDTNYFIQKDGTNDFYSRYLYRWCNGYPVEVWDSNLQKWIYLFQEYHQPCHMIAPTSQEPILLNRHAGLGNSPNVKGLVSSKDAVNFYRNGIEIYSLDSKRLKEMCLIAKSDTKFSSDNYVSSFKELSPFIKDQPPICSQLYKDQQFSSNYIKCKSDDFIKIESGFKYVILEALDLNSRAFILPMYGDTRRNSVYNQLIDIEQILIRNPLPVRVQNASRGVVYKDFTNISRNKNLLSTDIFEKDSNYVYTEIVNISRYLCVADLYDACSANFARSNSNTTAQHVYNNTSLLGANTSHSYETYNRATAVRECYGFAPNYKYINVKGLDE